MALDTNKIKNINPMDSMLNERSRSMKQERTKSVEIPIDEIDENEKNFYSVEDVNDLILAIRVGGFTVPLVVFQKSDGRYKLLSGHRRLKAVKELVKMGSWKKDTIPCIVKDLDNLDFPEGKEEITGDEKELYILIQHNDTSREYSQEDLMEEVAQKTALYESFKKKGIKKILIGQDSETGEEIYQELVGKRIREIVSENMNVSPATVGNIMKINKDGSELLREKVAEGVISIGTGKQIASLPKEKQDEILESSQGEKITDGDVKALTNNHKADTDSNITQTSVDGIKLKKDDVMKDLNRIRKIAGKYDNIDFTPNQYKRYEKALKTLEKILS